jgi:hypothetical protein
VPQEQFGQDWLTVSRASIDLHCAAPTVYAAATFWIGHFRLLRSLTHTTVGLIYLSLLQLFWIVLLPISTSLFIRIQTKKTITIMGANLTLIALCGLLMWIYSYRTGLFETEAITHPIAVELVGPVFPLLAFALSLVVTLWAPVLGDKLWWAHLRPLFSSISLEGLALQRKCSQKRQPMTSNRLTARVNFWPV